MPQYKLGLFGGSFDPLHLGHLRTIAEASTLCSNVLLVLSVSDKRDSIPENQRYRWLYEATQHLGNVAIVVVHDDAETNDLYNWQAGARLITQLAAETFPDAGPIDAVFCGDDYAAAHWEALYPGATIVITPRDQITSSAIRANPMANWDCLPKNVQPYYVKKVLITGGESTGKSTLTQNLARYYNTVHLEEVGREISQRSGDTLRILASDYLEIVLAHKLKELELINHANKVLFIDTDVVTTEFYANNFLNLPTNQCDFTLEQLSASIQHFNSYDLVLFLEPSVEFIDDGTRTGEIESNRSHYSQQLFSMHSTLPNMHIIGGDYHQRFTAAVRLTNALLGEIDIGFTDTLGSHNPGQ